MTSRMQTDSPAPDAGESNPPPPPARGRPVRRPHRASGPESATSGAAPPAVHPPESDAAPPAIAGEIEGSNPDAPVRYEVAMPRGLFNRLTDHENAPRCRYDMATGRAEFVAEPGPAHEWRAGGIASLISRVEDALDDAGQPPGFFIGRATRLLSDDGAFEPDECLFIDPPKEPDLREFDGYLDARKGHPVPDLVVEIERSAESSHKLAPYFRMGVREAWTFSRRDGARIWEADPDTVSGFRAADRSRVLPGLGRDDLEQLLEGRSISATSRLSRQLAKRIARTILVNRSGVSGDCLE